MSALKAISAFKLSPELKARLFNPYVAMLIVLAMYIVKTVTKLTAGYITNSPVFTSDGFHNLSDILQAVAVMIVVYMARRPPSAEYPLGKRNIEFFSSLIIGISLLAHRRLFVERRNQDIENQPRFFKRVCRHGTGSTG